MAIWVKPDLPGTSIKIVGETIQTIPPSIADIVAIPFVHDSGPLGVDSPGVSGELGGPQLLESFSEFERLYGTSDTAGRRAVLQAFQGVGLDGQGGAGGVLAVRMAGTGVLAASKLITNTTPATALTITSKWKGTAANGISYAIAADPRIAANDMFRLLFNGVEVERYSYLRTDVASLAAAINARPSSYITAVSNITGVALTVTAGTSLTGGNDGAALTSVEWLAALDQLEFKSFSILAPYLLTDPTIRAAVVAWVQGQIAADRPLMLAVGGDNSDTVSTAITRAQGINDPHVVTLGAGIYHDDLLGRDINTAELAPRIAGVLAARGLKSALTFADLAGLHAVSGTPVTSDLVALKNGGVTAIHLSETGEAELHVVWGVTTFTNKSDIARPYAYFSEPRLVRLNDIFIRQMRLWANSFVIGDLPVNDDTRDAVRTHGRGLIDAMLRAGLLDPAPEPFIRTPVSGDPNFRDSVLFEFGWQASFTANFVLGQGRVR